MPQIRRKTIKRGELARLAAINSKRSPHTVDLEGRRLRWVGIGWVDEGPADGTEEAEVIKDKEQDDASTDQQST